MCILKVISIIAVIIIGALSIEYCKKAQRFFDRVISRSFLYQILLLFFAAGVVFCVFFLIMQITNAGLKLGLSDWIFSFINPGATFEQAVEDSDRAWAIIFGVLGMVFLSGLLISVISNILERRVDKIKNGQAHYPFKNHVVIIGYDRMSISLICQLAKDERYCNSEIVLLTTREVPKIRYELFSRLDSKIEKKVTIISGNRTLDEDLRRLHIDNSKGVYILGENDEYDRDSLNVECVKKVDEILLKASIGKPVRCNVMFEYQSTFSIFQRQDIEGIKDRIEFVPFNYYEMWAQKVFVDRRYKNTEKNIAVEEFMYTPLDREGITADSDKKVRLVVLGMSNMGVAMGIQAAHLCHFPNFVTKGIKTRITFIDEHADREMNFLRSRYRSLFNETDVYYREVECWDIFNESVIKNEAARISPRAEKETFTDIEFEFIKARVEYPAIQEYLACLSRYENTCLTIAVCFSFTPQAIAAGLYLPDDVYNNHIPVLVQQETSHCTLDMLSGDGKFKNIKPFGMLDDWYNLEKADDLMPMMIKYMYDKTSKKDETCIQKIEAVKTFAPGVMRENWNNWTDGDGKELKNTTALKWSNIYHANMAQIKKRSLDIIPGKELNSKQINLLARVEHNRWNIEKLLMGYRPCTPEEADDIANRRKSKQELRNVFIHNDIRPYETLAEDDKGIQAREYDVAISRSLPFMLSELEKFNNDHRQW